MGQRSEEITTMNGSKRNFSAPRGSMGMHPIHGIYDTPSEQGLQGVSRRHRKSRTKRSSTAISSKDLVQRQFRAVIPNELWVADATYVPTGEGVLYLAIVLDVFARRIVGWSMAARQDSELMVCALQMALSRRQPRQVIHHSDQGSQYTSKHFLETCKNANVQVSMGSVVIVMTTRCPRVSLLR